MLGYMNGVKKKTMKMEEKYNIKTTTFLCIHIGREQYT